MTGVLVIAGLTGAVLAFNSELERVFAPRLFATSRPDVPALDLATLAIRAEALVFPQGHVTGVLRTERDQVEVYVAANDGPEPGRRFDLGYTQLFVDPWTGVELGRRRRGDLSEGLINLMPFIYAVHWTLACGVVGQWLFGLVAIAWSLDCFVGFSLTLPISREAFWRRWLVAWRIKGGASVYRLNVDLHRASGLWLWPLLFVFAWSSVMMNIRPFYEAVTRTVFDYESPRTAVAALGRQANEHPRLGWRAALDRGQQLMAAAAARDGFAAGQPLGLQYRAELGAYAYEVRGSRDLFERAPKGGSTVVTFDGDTGRLLRLSQPTGGRAGNTVESWLYALHMARVFGRPYQVFVCALGFVVSMLSVTGVYLWWKKRGFRQVIAARQAQRRDHLRPSVTDAISQPPLIGHPHES